MFLCFVQGTLAQKNVSIGTSVFTGRTLFPNMFELNLRAKNFEINGLSQLNKNAGGWYISKGVGGTIYFPETNGGQGFCISGYYVWDIYSTSIEKEKWDGNNYIIEDDYIVKGIIVLAGGMEGPFSLRETISGTRWYNPEKEKKRKDRILHIMFQYGASYIPYEDCLYPFLKIGIKYYL